MEDGEPSAWSAAAFISAIQQEKQQQEEQNGGQKYHKMAPAVSVPSIFTRGSYRRYMNYLIKSNSSDKLHNNSLTRTADAPLTDSRRQKFRGEVCWTHTTKQGVVTTDKTSSHSHAYRSSYIGKAYSPEEKPPVTPVPGGDATNYVVSNRNLNSRISRPVSLVSVSRFSSDMKGPVVPTNSVETDGGVVVDNKGDAPFHSTKYPSSYGRAIACESGAEVDETPLLREKCSTKESNKGRQRKTGAVAGSRSHLAGAEQEADDAEAQTSTVLRFPCVEKLIRRYTAMITDQKERAMSQKQAQNTSRGKQNQGNVENKFSNQNKEFSGNSSKKNGVPLLQKHEFECSKQSMERVQDRGQITAKSTELGQYSERVKHCEFDIDSGDGSIVQNDLQVREEHPEKHLQKYVNEAVELPAGELQGKGFKNVAKLHKEEDFRADPLQCECGSDSVQHKTSRSERSDDRDYVTGFRVHGEKKHYSVCTEKRFRQWHVTDGLTDDNIKIHHQQQTQEDLLKISESEHCNNRVCEEQQVCEENNKEETDGSLQQTSESVTSLFIKSSTHVTQNISHVGGTTTSAIQDEGRHKLILPRAAQRSASPASDEGCSVVAPPEYECGLTPCSSEGDIVKRLVEESTARWTWPPESDDQDIEFQGQIRRNECRRCGSSDSAVCLLPTDDERRLHMKDARLSLRKVSVDSDILDIITSRDPSCDKAMVFDRYMNKISDVSFELDNLHQIWGHGSFSSECRRDSDVFPDSVSTQCSVDHGDTWFEETRNVTTEAVCEDLCDSGIDRGTFLGRTGDLCWDSSSGGAKTGEFSPDDDRYRPTAANVYGYPWKYRQRHFGKLRSMLSFESGVVEDEDCSRKSSTAEGADNPDDDDYRVELRRQSAQSFQTDDEESSANSQYRYWRTPSVVVSDYSDDGPHFTSVTLEELEQLQDVSSSECASGASSVSGSVGVSVGDTEYGLRTPERKASDCSTCSTLSGDEEASCDALLQPLRTRQKVGYYVCFCKPCCVVH